jgi:hypothetical protein
VTNPEALQANARPVFGPDEVAALAALYGTGSDNLDELAGPTHWPELPADEAADVWAELGAWVTRLQGRFAHLDHHVLPRCWYRHNGHVEALIALRDHEQLSFSASAPATAALDWFRALRDVEALLRAWTAQLACGAAHAERPPARTADPDDLATVAAADVARRRDAAVRAAIAGT